MNFCVISYLLSMWFKIFPTTKLTPIAKNNGPEVRAKIVVAPEIPFTAIAAIAD